MEENQEVFLSMKNEIEKQSQREVDAIMAEVKKMEEEAYSSMQKFLNPMLRDRKSLLINVMSMWLLSSRMREKN